jgi:hypothetical protein
MKRHHSLVIGAVALSCAISMSACEGTPKKEVMRPASASRARTHSVSPEDLARMRREAEDAYNRDEPQGILDRSGEVAGYLRPSEERARNREVDDAMRADGIDVEHKTIDQVRPYDVLFPVEVRRDGKVVAYLTDRVVSLDEYPKQLAEARARLRR